MQLWAYGDKDEQVDKFNYYVIIVVAIGLGIALFTLFRTITQVFAGIRVGKKMHNWLMNIVFRAPINIFFDVTPIGKILNRFSKD